MRGSGTQPIGLVGGLWDQGCPCIGSSRPPCPSLLFSGLPREAKASLGTLVLAPSFLWLAAISALPHKEERFLFVVYPLVRCNPSAGGEARVAPGRAQRLRGAVSSLRSCAE